MIGEILQIFSGYAPAFAFFSALFLGNSTVVGFAFLASQGMIPFWITAFFCFLGIISADLLYYSIGRTNRFNKITNSNFFNKMFKRVDDTVDELTGKSPFLALFYTKFTIGTKILVSSYLGQKKVPLKQFFLSTILASMLWMLIALTLGYFAGQGFKWVLSFFRNLPLAMLVLLIMIAIFIHVHKKSHNHIINKHHSKKKKNAKLSHKKR